MPARSRCRFNRLLPRPAAASLSPSSRAATSDLDQEERLLLRPAHRKACLEQHVRARLPLRLAKPRQVFGMSRKIVFGMSRKNEMRFPRDYMI
jgi:hypothetical protein